jgi:hypothetical protein
MAAAISAFLALVATGITVWYTVETRQLRKISLAQYYIMISPYVLVRLGDRFTVEQGDVRHSQVLKAIPSARFALTEDESSYLFEVTAVDDRMPNHVMCVWFNAIDSLYRVSAHLVEAVKGNETVRVPLANQMFSPEEISTFLEHIYEERWHRNLRKYIVDTVPGMGKDMLVAIFFDHAGTLYAAPRGMRFGRERSKVEYDKSDLIVPPGMEKLSTPFASTVGRTRFAAYRADRRFEDLLRAAEEDEMRSGSDRN